MHSKAVGSIEPALSRTLLFLHLEGNQTYKRCDTIRKHGSSLNVALRLVFALRAINIIMNRFLCSLVLLE